MPYYSYKYLSQGKRYGPYITAICLRFKKGRCPTAEACANERGGEICAQPFSRAARNRRTGADYKRFGGQYFAFNLLIFNSLNQQVNCYPAHFSLIDPGGS